ncbi:MAG: FlgD immunoglobulin-like domain containing protein [bacterium]
MLSLTSPSFTQKCRNLLSRTARGSKVLAALLFVGFAVWSANEARGGGNCDSTSTQKTPINDLGPGLYQGFQGGLYPDGLNAPPPPFDSIGVAIANGIVPLDTNGVVDLANGAIVFETIGMSNAKAESQPFVSMANGDPLKNPALFFINGADPGQTADKIADPAADYWNYVQDQVAKNGYTNAQVQVVWVKEATPLPVDPFPTEAVELQGFYEDIARNLKALFPNLKIAYYSSRIYAGYATGPLNPEPHAYETAFAVKWMIEKQINGDLNLNFDPEKGAVVAPYLAWGPYLWADGLIPRSDSLVWLCDDLANDGTHPSDQGSDKVANLLLNFLKTDTTAVPWFFNSELLPVELTSFQATVLGADVELRWSTATETNNLGFQIQRKQGQAPYESIGFVKGHGTTFRPNSYRYVDKDLAPNSFTYRLKQIDLDGTPHFSSQVKVVVAPPREFVLGPIYPNPFKNRANIPYRLADQAAITIRVFNLLGQEIRRLESRQQDAGEFLVQWDGLDDQNRTAANGIYIVTLWNRGDNGGQKLVGKRKVVLLR